MIGTGECAAMLLANPALASGRTITIERVFAAQKESAVKNVAGHRVYSPAGLSDFLRKKHIALAVVAAPDPEVQALFSVLERSPVKVLLNFSPYRPNVTPTLKVFDFNLHVSLDIAAYHATHGDIPILPENALL